MNLIDERRRMKRKDCASGLVPLVERSIASGDSLFANGDRHEHLKPVPPNEDAVSPRLVLGNFINVDRQRHTRPSKHATRRFGIRQRFGSLNQIRVNRLIGMVNSSPVLSCAETNLGGTANSLPGKSGCRSKAAPQLGARSVIVPRAGSPRECEHGWGLSRSPLASAPMPKEQREDRGRQLAQRLAAGGSPAHTLIAMAT